MPDLQWKKLKEIVDQSDNIVFFGGAGGFTIRMQFWKAQGFRTTNAAA